ncbi:MAG: ChrR family anti-sigma-E factor [Caldimonas sp.]
MIQHHPDEVLLAALAAGRLACGPAVVTATHLELCPRCRARLGQYEAVGGALLEAAEPAVLAAEALVRTLARIDELSATADASAPAAPPAHATSPAHSRAAARFLGSLPTGMRWPQSLAGCTPAGWRWLGPGMRWSRLRLADDPAANVFLLRIAAGKNLPLHSHRGLELTQVLHGAFDDGRARFDAGDFDGADDAVHHQPVVEAGGECICLASVEGRVAFDGRVAQVFGALVGM